SGGEGGGSVSAPGAISSNVIVRWAGIMGCKASGGGTGVGTPGSSCAARAEVSSEAADSPALPPALSTVGVKVGTPATRVLPESFADSAPPNNARSPLARNDQSCQPPQPITINIARAPIAASPQSQSGSPR